MYDHHVQEYLANTWYESVSDEDIELYGVEWQSTTTQQLPEDDIDWEF